MTTVKPDQNQTKILRQRFHELRKLATTVNLGTNVLFDLVTTKCLAKNESLSYLYEPCRAAVQEIASILKDSDATIGYHLNRIGSGKEAIDIYEEDDEHQTRKFLGTCATDEEAAALMEDNTKDCYSVHYDPDEWWAILDTKGRTQCGTMYSTQNDAYVAMLSLADEKVPAWNEYNRLLDEHNINVPFHSGPHFIHEDDDKGEV